MNFLNSLKKKPLRTFEQVVDEEAANSDELSRLLICHTTTEGYFFNILTEGELGTNNLDPIYNEALVYFFYGKPSYIVSDDLQNYEDNPPITFLYNLDDLKDYPIKRMLPFDSGGFKLYGVTKGYDLKNFTHNNPNPTTIQALVRLLYGNNKAYLATQLDKDNIKHKAKYCWYLQEIVDIYEKIGKAKVKYGRQAFSIELQYATSIKIDPRHIIIPFTLLTDKNWALEDFYEIFPETEIWVYGSDNEDEHAMIASEFHTKMLEKVREIMMANN